MAGQATWMLTAQDYGCVWKNSLAPNRDIELVDSVSEQFWTLPGYFLDAIIHMMLAYL